MQKSILEFTSKLNLVSVYYVIVFYIDAVGNDRFIFRFSHSNDSHQCPILAADFVIFYYGTENEEAIWAGARSE